MKIESSIRDPTNEDNLWHPRRYAPQNFPRSCNIFFKCMKRRLSPRSKLQYSKNTFLGDNHIKKKNKKNIKKKTTPTDFSSRVCERRASDGVITNASSLCRVPNKRLPAKHAQPLQRPRMDTRNERHKEPNRAARFEAATSRQAQSKRRGEENLKTGRVKSHDKGSVHVHTNREAEGAGMCETQTNQSTLGRAQWHRDGQKLLLWRKVRVDRLPADIGRQPCVPALRDGKLRRAQSYASEEQSALHYLLSFDSFHPRMAGRCALSSPSTRAGP